MHPIRIIPRLDTKGPNLVKGIHLEGLRVLGKPEAFARYYYEQGADELLYVDVVASLYGRNSLLPLIERTAKEIEIAAVAHKSIVAARDIKAGEIFTEENLTIKRPGTVMSPMEWDKIIGAKAKQDFKADGLL